MFRSPAVWRRRPAAPARHQARAPTVRWFTCTLFPAGAAAKAADRQRPLRQGVNLTVWSLQRRCQKGAALQTAGVADRRCGDVDACTGRT